MDVVPTRKEQMASGSATDRIYCQPCAEDGNKILSEAFCPVCKEFLCSTCARVHRNQKMTKSHRLQDKDSVPTSFRDESEYKSYTEICQRHAKEIIKYYCHNHETLLCGDCLVEDEEHRSCKVEKLPQVVKRFKHGVEYNNLKTGLVQTASDIDKLSHEIHAILKLVDEESQNNINELRNFRNEINQYLDKKENELLAEIDQKKRTSNTLINGLKSKCTNMNSSIEKLKSELQAQHDNGNQLLIVGKRAIKELAGIQAALEVSRRSKVPRYKFHRNPAIEQSIASENAIGGLEEGESTSALGQQHRKQKTKQEERQQETVKQHKKNMEALSQKGESTSVSGQQPRQLKTMPQQQDHMQGVSPKGKAQMASGSALDRIYCQPCAGGGKKIHSEAFCPVCKEFLCFTCARVHRNQKMTKSHRLQDKDSLPTSFRDDSEYESYTEICQRHAKEIIKYYCLNHETLLCSDCVVEDEKHRSCKMDKLPQVVKRFKQGVEYNSLKTGLVQTASDIDKLSHEIHAILKLVDEESQTNINELRKLRNEINQYLDKKENELLAEIDQKKRISNTLINGLKSKCTNMKSSIEKLKSELQAQHDNGNQLLIVGKRAIKELAGIQAALEVSRRSEVPRYKFHRNSAIEQSIASERELGQLEEGESMSALGQQQRQKQAKEEQRQQKTVQQHNKHMEALSQKGESTSASGQEPRQLEATQQQQEHMQGVSPKAHIMSQASFSRAKFSRQPEISVKTSFDTRDSFLTSMTLLTGDRLLLVDRVNDSLKLVNTPTNKVLSQVKLPGGPWDLCLLPGDRGAVTLLLEGKIQFVSTQGNVTLQDVVKVDGQCRGIDFCDDNLIVSFSSPGKVVLMDMKGKVKKIMDKDNSGTPLFQQPYYLTVTRGSQTTPVIYVSDCGTNTITKLSISLDVLQSFQDPTLISPYGQAGMGDTQLLVCGGRSNNIQLLDTLTGDITQLIGKEAGIEGPYNVAYCSLRKMVFVTCSQYGRPDLKNFVKVFNLV